MFRESEINQFDGVYVLFQGDNDVVRMQVPKHNPALPQKHQPLHNLPHNNRDILLAIASPVKQINHKRNQRPLRAVLLDHVEKVLVGVVAVRLHHVFVSLSVMGEMYHGFEGFYLHFEVLEIVVHKGLADRLGDAHEAGFVVDDPVDVVERALGLGRGGVPQERIPLNFQLFVNNSFGS